MSIFFRSPNLFPHLKQLIFTSKYFIHKKRPKVVTDKNLIQSSARNLKKIEDKSQKIVKEK